MEKSYETFNPYVRTKFQAASEKASHDFRSDVITVPTEEMMMSILEATVNDDIYDEQSDPIVKALDSKMIELTGKEAALWIVSGTQGNQICLRTHLTQQPHSVLLDHRTYVYCWESGAHPVISQAVSTAADPKSGVYLTLEGVKANTIADGNSKCVFVWLALMDLWLISSISRYDYGI
ncbi:hypothetical protein QQS21_010196 [Conoideocrella luteorostrata]|uniref:Aromatic amino acid beta-eliminating lyase/threonine aldolase domain-containing protein n=1 Tax=Conoideocrella luteorostrata TaxID=1105319 RepID=A0AAJ0FX47_9HYPO|nr:hypothetical protein QQS21_010196 [Conoideocrella luteorostrata]